MLRTLQGPHHLIENGTVHQPSFPILQFLPLFFPELRVGLKYNRGRPQYQPLFFLFKTSSFTYDEA